MKYKESWDSRELKGLHQFVRRHECHIPAVVTKHGHQFGLDKDRKFFEFPLLLFLLLFDA